MKDTRWRRLLSWVRERNRHYRQVAADNRYLHSRDDDARAEIMGGVLAVMEMETRRHRKAQKSKKSLPKEDAETR